MVKFGRHLHYYTHNELRDSALYVVPYNDIKGKCMPGHTVRSAGPKSPDRDRDRKGGEKSSSSSRQEERRWDDSLFEIPKANGDGDGAGAAPGSSRIEDGFVRIDAADAKPASALASPSASSDGGGGSSPGRWEKLESDFYFATQRFKTEWRSCLALAGDDFERSTRDFWRGVFGGVMAAAAAAEGGGAAPRIDQDTIRGCLPDTALRLFLAVSPPPQTQEMYEHLKDIHSTALVNSEALRKLVKKFDKDVDKLCTKLNKELGRGGGEAKLEEGIVGLDGKMFRLSGELLPEVYSSNFNVGLPTVEAGLALVRAHLGLDDEEDDDEHDVSSIQAARIRFMSMDQQGMSRARNLADMGGGGDHSDDDNAAITPEKDVAGFFGLTLQRRDSDAVLVEKRKIELRWLRKLVASLEEQDRIDAENEGGAIIVGEGMGLIGCLVGHRGFHSIKDRSDKRPLENSQMAYEAAWTNGIHLCECDITLTRDDRIILCHDENFTRLALDPDDPRVKKHVRDLTYREIMNLPLKSGVRPPLLFDVLRSAHAIGGEARMIVEIKPGNTEAGTALARMFAKHPQLMERCAVVMSFDAFAMQNLRRELEAVFPTTPRIHPSPPSSARLRKDPDPNRAEAAALPPHPPPPHSHSHRRGVSMVGSGVLPNIPTAMSIGDIHGLGVPAAHPAVDPASATTGGGHTVAFEETARTDSVDQLGMSLESMGMRKGDSFHFSPFKRVSSMNRNRSGGALSSTIGRRESGAVLIPPLSPRPAPPVLPALPVGVRLEDSGGGSAHPPATGAASGGGGEPQTVAIPKLLLITRCGPAQNEEQRDALKVDVSEPTDLSRALSWLQGNSPQERLDGLYLQFQPCMLEPEGIAACRTLTDHYSIGVWGANPKRDDVETFTQLVKECGVSYVNSGLPKKFFRNVARRASGNALAAMVGMDGDAAANMEENSKTWAHPGRQQAQQVHLGLPW